MLAFEALDRKIANLIICSGIYRNNCRIAAGSSLQENTGCMLHFKEKRDGIIGGGAKLEVNPETLDIFKEAGRFDESLALEPLDPEKITLKRLATESFSFEHLFENLAESRPCLYSDYCARGSLASYGLGMERSDLLPILRESQDTFRYQISRELGREPVPLTVGELLHEWDRDERLLRITNIHLRTIDLVDSAELDLVCPFNLLTHGNSDLKKLEMMTLMVSTTGAITESHSDDTDVNNHCVAGRKLWLCWDTSEGMRAGLEDCEKVDVYGKPKFSLEAFLQLESSTWVLVSEGETLFLPGNYTHKVITLEKYIGIGGFFVSFPTLLQVFERWLGRRQEYQHREPLYRRRHGELMAESVESSLLETSRELFKRLSSAGESAWRQWGAQYAGRPAKEWGQGSNHAGDCDLEQNRRLRECLAFVREVQDFETQV